MKSPLGILSLFKPLTGKTYKYLVKARVEECREVIRTYEVEANSVEDAKERYYWHGIVTECENVPCEMPLEMSQPEVVSVQRWRKSYYKERYMIIAYSKKIAKPIIAMWDLTYKEANQWACELKAAAEERLLADPKADVYEHWWVMKMEPNFGEEY